MSLFACCLFAAPAAGDWPTFSNQTATRLSSDAAVGINDTEEKDYAWGDVDHDTDIDLVVVRKQPFTSSGGRRGVLFLNVNGVLTDMTASKIPGLMDAINNRDVKLVDVNNDTWLDIVTAAACNGCSNPGSNIVDDSRLYMNLGAPAGTWLGYGTPVVLLGAGNNTCDVGPGDVTGDGYADLYFASYLDSFEDQLFINGGPASPGTFTIQNNRLTAAMRASDFGTAAVIADMDNDGDKDIVKSQNSPVNMFRNSGAGFFDLNDFTYENAAYHVEVGFLNGDGLLDLAISDDGVDKYILNNGNLLNGGPDTTLSFPSSTNGFGSELVITDLDADGWNDVFITDVDVDIPGCDRVTDLIRNNNGSSFTSNQSNISTALLTGVHDIAIFDISGDGFKDVVIGRCNGTTVMINSPPVAIAFQYPNGLPGFVAPAQSTTFQVNISPVGGTVAPGTPAIHVSLNGGAFSNTPLTAIGGQSYEAVIPPGACGDNFKFYLSAQLSGGPTFNDPPTAPGSAYSTIAAEGTIELYADAFEGDVSSWTISSNPGLTSGEWEQADPNATIFAGQLAAPENDATPDPGDMAFVTENGAPGGSSSAADVDGGPTYLVSPAFNLQDNDGLVTYSRWVFSATGQHDVLQVEVSNNNGANWVLAQTVTGTGSAWESASFFVSSYVTPSAQVKVRFSICDCPNDSTTEAGIDDFKIEVLDCGKTPCPWDLDGTGTVGSSDFLALLGAWGPNPGHPADFDGSGDVGSADFLALLGHWGDCP